MTTKCRQIAVKHLPCSIRIAPGVGHLLAQASGTVQPWVFIVVFLLVSLDTTKRGTLTMNTTIICTCLQYTQSKQHAMSKATQAAEDQLEELNAWNLPKRWVTRVATRFLEEPPSFAPKRSRGSVPRLRPALRRPPRSESLWRTPPGLRFRDRIRRAGSDPSGGTEHGQRCQSKRPPVDFRRG